MKNLYDIVEGILDDQDDVMDKMTDDFYTRVGQTLAEWCQGKYNAKSRTIKMGGGYTLCITARNGQICIYNGATRTYNPIDEIAGVQVGLDGLKDYKFDCDILLSPAAVKLGFALDKIQWVGKQNVLHLYDDDNKPISLDVLTKAIGSSQIPPGSKLDLSSESWDQDVLTSNICFEFDAVQVSPGRWGDGDKLETLKNCKAQKLIISDVREWLNIGYKYKTMSDALKAEKSDFTGYAYSTRSSYDRFYGDKKKTVAQQLKNLMANNPGVTLIMTPGFRDWEVIDNDLNCKKLSGVKYWTKV